MGAKTGIEWCDSTWNPIRGCSRVSAGCRHCYAESMAARFSKPGLAYEGLAVMSHGKPHWTGKIEFVEKHLLDPLKWGQVNADDQCKLTRPRRIFVNSMSDLFHENVTDEMRDKIFAVMALCPQHIFQVLTKRPKRMLEHFAPYRGACLRIGEVCDAMGYSRWSAWPYGNVWLGVSVENQQAADERIPLLLRTPAALRFISAEPLLENVDLTLDGLACRPCSRCEDGSAHEWDTSANGCPACDGTSKSDELAIDWVICGGESGPGARPMQPEWARGLRDQCQAAGVPFLFKQWGEYLPPMTDGALIDGGQELNCSDDFVRVGKRAAGSLLDGKEWKQFPGL